jgi:hypothetical protein
VDASSPSYVYKAGEVPNYLYFGLDNLPLGTHTLLVNVTEANNQTFMLDYITYRPTFSTLSSMPPLSPIPSLSPSSSTAQQSVTTGALVSGVIGGVLVAMILAILWVILRRRRAQGQGYAYRDHHAARSSGVNDPNILSVSNPPLSFSPFDSPLLYRSLLTQTFQDARTPITPSLTASDSSWTHFTSQ